MPNPAVESHENGWPGLAIESRLIMIIESDDQPHDQALCFSNPFAGRRLRSRKVA
jgi:hypothetical protein